jgi:chemotaxis protein methyltransferase WspC
MYCFPNRRFCVMKRIEHRLRETIGLNTASVGSGIVQRAVRHRMRSLGLKRQEDYLHVLQRSQPEWQELVEWVVVKETWFFRDPEPIAAFVRLVREGWMSAHAAPPLRLLSIPCSSGEEPFSLAMALLDAGLPPERFQIEAVDISSRALARATVGVYGKNSFRSKDLTFRDRHFQPTDAGFVLAPAVRNCVRFYQGNLLSDSFLTGRATYDFIFCRNLLIYFDTAMRKEALDKLERLLTPCGVLFLSPVEQPLAVEHGFVTVSIPMSFACRKAGHGPRHPQPESWKRPSGVPPPHRGSRLPARFQVDGWPARHAPGATSPLLKADLETARYLAEAGRLEEATEICRAHLRDSRDSPQAYYLLGLVREAGGEADAIDCYRKALYLEPNHYESLLRMALLLKKNGEATRARTFQSRAQRIRPKT